MGKLKDSIDILIDDSYAQGHDGAKIAYRLIEAGLRMEVEERQGGFEECASAWDGKIPFRGVIGTKRLLELDFGTPDPAPQSIASGYLYVGPGEPNIPVERLPEMVAAIRWAGNQFDTYARNHLAKGPEHTSKAITNIKGAVTMFKSIDEAYIPPFMPPVSESASMDDWKSVVQAGQELQESDSGSLVAGSAQALLKGLYGAESGGAPMLGVSVHLDDRPILDTLVELGYVNRGEVDDLVTVTTMGKEAIGVRPDGVPDLPVEVASVTGNIEEKELVGRYVDQKVKGIESAIAKNAGSEYKDGYEITARVLAEIGHEIRIGMHIPETIIEGRVIPYNEDRSTGYVHAESLDRFFADVYARNVKAGWWTNIEDGTPKKRNVGELFILMVTELAEAYKAYVLNEMDDKLPQYHGVGVEMGDLLIRVADFCGALAAGNIVEYDPGSHNPGHEMFMQVAAIADRYEAIRKTPEAVGDTECGDFWPALSVGPMIDAKLAYNAKREDHKIENRLKEDGKKT